MTAPQAALKWPELSNSPVSRSICKEVLHRGGGDHALHVSCAHMMPPRHLLCDSPLLHPITALPEELGRPTQGAHTPGHRREPTATPVGPR